jgi:hypothetical protein
MVWRIRDRSLHHLKLPHLTAQRLIDGGYLLAEDLERILAQSARRWDLLAAAQESAAAAK